MGSLVRVAGVVVFLFFVGCLIVFVGLVAVLLVLVDGAPLGVSFVPSVGSRRRRPIQDERGGGVRRVGLGIRGLESVIRFGLLRVAGLYLRCYDGIN